MKRIFLVGLVFGFFLCGMLGVANAITFGEPDGDEHPYVGTLLFVQNGEGYYSCTGTLISPTVMLTAGHCTEEAGNVNDITYVRFTEDAMEGYGPPYGSTQEWLDAKWILAAEVIPHPQYADFVGFPNTYDVGLVILSEPVFMDEYGELPSLGFLEEVLSEKGNSTNWWTAVGFGVHGADNPFPGGDDYARYQVTTRLVELNSKNDGPGASAKFTNHPGRKTGGTCFGDSGEPLFYQDSNTIGAIVSFGITPCIGVDYQFRIDTETAQDFILNNP